MNLDGNIINGLLVINNFTILQIISFVVVKTR